MDYLLYVAGGFGILTFLSLMVDLFIMRNNEIEAYTIIRCKNKTQKARRYCYPKVVAPNGKEFYVYTAKKRGHDLYVEGETLEFYAPGLLNRKPRCRVGFFQRTYSIAIVAVMALVVYFLEGN